MAYFQLLPLQPQAHCDSVGGAEGQAFCVVSFFIASASSVSKVAFRCVVLVERVAVVGLPLLLFPSVFSDTFRSLLEAFLVLMKILGT